MSVAPAPLRAGPTGAPDRSGRIPFRIRIGVTGHREISADLTDAISIALDRLQERLIGGRPHDATEVRLAVVSELAEGGDRVVVRGVFEYARKRGEDGALGGRAADGAGAVSEVQGFDERSRAEFERMLDDATFTIEPPPATLARHEERADAYAVAAASWSPAVTCCLPCGTAGRRWEAGRNRRHLLGRGRAGQAVRLDPDGRRGAEPGTISSRDSGRQFWPRSRPCRGSRP